MGDSTSGITKHELAVKHYEKLKKSGNLKKGYPAPYISTVSYFEELKKRVIKNNTFYSNYE